MFSFVLVLHLRFIFYFVRNNGGNLGREENSLVELELFEILYNAFASFKLFLQFLIREFELSFTTKNEL